MSLMHKVGILLHVYNLGCQDWEQLVWGIPEQDKLGTGAKLLECLLDEPAENEVIAMVYDGPSSKDGLSEGEYTRRFLLDKFDELKAFPRFRHRLQGTSSSARDVLRQRVERIILGDSIRSTLDEIKLGGRDFHARGIDKVIHIAAASHAPRCIQLQLVAREHGWIPANQHWSTVASDLAFAGMTAEDVFIAEPPHRADDPLIGFEPTLPQILKPFFYGLTPRQQQDFLRLAAGAMSTVQQAGARKTR